MKFLTAILLVSSFQAFACEKDEAQIIAEVTRVESDAMMHCTAYVSADSISLYNEHRGCPLAKEDVIEQGIEFPLINGHDCEIYVGDVVTGVLYTRGHDIRLE